MNRKTVASGLGVVSIWAIVGIAPGMTSRAMAFSLSSSAFGANSEIPQRHTCEGSATAKERKAPDMNAGVSPALAWDDPPAGTKAFALVVNDPDAPLGSWIHWIIYDIPATTRTIAEATVKSPTIADGSKHGLNQWGNPFYQGPCPPAGDPPHHYVFTLYALDAVSGLEAGSKTSLVQQFISKHTIGKVELVGRFGR
jgi:Raf kinase inhibitor-like YbhB/YbcL family protein